MRAIWKGGISFGLIYIPVGLYSATEPVQIDLDMLSKKDLAPIRYARIDTKTGKEVAWKDIVKGFEYKKGDYVIIDENDFDKVDIKKSSSIEIQCFVNDDEIDPKYFEKPYYLEPVKGAEKTYALLVKALEKSKKVGVAEFVLRNRERLCILKPDKGMLILNQMRYEDEIRSPEDLNIKKDAKIQKNELDMAISLIDQMSDEFKSTDYKDDYIKGMKKLIEAKAKNKKVKIDKYTPQKATEVSDLMEQLKKSLESVEVKR